MKKIIAAFILLINLMVVVSSCNRDLCPAHGQIQKAKPAQERTA